MLPDFFRANTGLVVSCAIVVVLLSGYYFFISPPANFPSGDIVTISQGASASQVAKHLAEAHVIRCPLILEIALRIGGGSTSIQSGAYLFQKPQNLFTVAYRIATGTYGLPAVRITFVEGATVREMSEQIAEVFSDIQTEEFGALAKTQEGYLFPDTYFFSPVANAASIVKTLRENFDEKMKPLQGEIWASGHPLSDIVSMAAIIEKEAHNDTDRHMISGILWNRFKIGMPLQVDAAPETYKHIGFPATPICNPGLDAIDSALHPTKTDYMYYLTGKDGKMYYAKTFDVHQSNRRKYLR